MKGWKGEEGKWKVVSPFSFSNLFYLFLNFFDFIKCKGEKKQIYCGKGEKKMLDLWVREKIQMQMVEKMG
jgi:hypothetical protein